MKQINLNHILSLIDEETIHLRLKEACEITSNNAVKAVESIGKTGKGKKYPLL